MKNTYKQIKKIEPSSIKIEPSRMFTYPSKLADVYNPQIMEVILPPYEVKTAGLKFCTYEGSTSSSEKPQNFRFKKINRLKMRLSSPLEIDDHEEHIYDARYGRDWNPGHTLIDIAGFLLEIKEILPNITVIFRQDAAQIGQEILKQLGFKVVCTDRHVKGKIVEVIVDEDPKIKPECALFHSKKFQSLEIPDYQKDTPERLFISRKPTSRRKLINDQEVGDFLKKYGFEKICLEDNSVNVNWSMCRNAKIVVTLLGSSSTPLIFNPNQVKLIDLLHPGHIIEYSRVVVNFVNGSYCRVTGEIKDDILKKLEKKHNYFIAKDYKIDIDSLAMGLDYLNVK